MPFLRLYSEGSLKAQWELGAARVTIGRAADNDIVLQDPEVSKYHAHVEPHGGDYVLVDDDSANGVLVGHSMVSQHRLRYWDEIQIGAYKLVFMSAARLPGEAAGHAIQTVPELEQSGTVVMQALDLGALREPFATPRVACITVVGSGIRMLLDKASFTLGRGRGRDLKCGGWLSPRLAATIERGQDGHYLIPSKRARTYVNGKPARHRVRLEDDYDLKVQGLALKYYFRAIDGA